MELPAYLFVREAPMLEQQQRQRMALNINSPFEMQRTSHMPQHWQTVRFFHFILTVT